MAFYPKGGKKPQIFDFSKKEDEYEFTIASANTNGTAVCIGSFDQAKIFTFSESTNKWSESTGGPLVIKNLYSVTALHWQPNGSKICLGSLVGSVELLDIASKKEIISSGKYEVSYVGNSQVVLKQLSTGASASVRSKFNYEITNVEMLEPSSVDTSYIIAWTNKSIIICDINSDSEELTEIPWHTNGSELFAFQKDAILVYSNGEIAILEPGKNVVTTTLRIDTDNCAHVSVRVTNPRNRNIRIDRACYINNSDSKSIVYLDLETGFQLETVNHMSKIAWLNLHENGNLLIFIDRRKQLWAIEFGKNNSPYKVLDYCKWASFVSGSDVLVAHDGANNLHVWYGSTQEKPVIIPTCKGRVKKLSKNSGKITVTMQEENTSNEFTYNLDSHMIEFISALEENNLSGAMRFLEKQQNQNSSECQAWWSQLEEIALEKSNLYIVQRCAAARNDFARVEYCDKVSRELDNYDFGDDGQNKKAWKTSPLLFARMSQLKGDYQQAEDYFLKLNEIDKIIDMYVTVKKYDQAVRVAQNAGNINKAVELENKQLSFLKQTGQEAKAAEFLNNNGQSSDALSLLMEAGLYARAAKLILNEPSLLSSREKVAIKLAQSDEFELAGQLYESAGDTDYALRLYRKGNVFNRAVDLARIEKPHEVIMIEREWAEYLLSKRQADAAILHFIEAGDNIRALEASIIAHQYNKASELLYSFKVDEKMISQIRPALDTLAGHFLNTGEPEKAAELYIQVKNIPQAVEALISATRYTEAYELLGGSSDENAKISFIEKAEKEVEEGNYKEAEKIFLAAESADKAITTYHKLGRTADCVRLAKIYYPDRLGEIYGSLAARAQENEQFKEAETLWIAAAREGYEQAIACCIDMYMGAASISEDYSMYEQAIRIAEQYNGPEEVQEVAYQWSKSCVNVQNNNQILSATGVKIIEMKSSPEWMIERALSGSAEENGEHGKDPHQNKNKGQKMAITDQEFARVLVKHFNMQDKLQHFRNANFYGNANSALRGGPGSGNPQQLNNGNNNDHELDSRDKEAEEYYLKNGRPQDAIAHYMKKENDTAFHRAIEIARENEDEVLYEETVRAVSNYYDIEGNDVNKAIQVYVDNGFIRQGIKICMEKDLKSRALKLAEEHIPQLIPRLKEYMVSTNLFTKFFFVFDFSRIFEFSPSNKKSCRRYTKFFTIPKSRSKPLSRLNK